MAPTKSGRRGEGGTRTVRVQDGAAACGRRHFDRCPDDSPRPWRSASACSSSPRSRAFALWPRGGPAVNHPRSSGSPPTSASVLQPVGATGFDPLTSPSADPGNENSQYAKYAIDNSLRTSWTSQWYASADFGRLKAGSGLLIDMGKPVKFATVTITFNSQPGSERQIASRQLSCAQQAEPGFHEDDRVRSESDRGVDVPDQGPADGTVPRRLVHAAAATAREQR